MNILFDFNHPVDVNVFKNAVRILAAEGHHIFITYRARGILKRVVETELGDFHPVRIGKHHRSSFLMKVVGQLYRDCHFIPFYRRNRIDLSVGTSTNVISAWIMRIPHLAFEDDIEYKLTFTHANLFATRHIMPDYIELKKKNIHHYRGLKELAYLHPRYYSPRLEELDPYGLKPEEYVFIRKIARVSLNYRKEDDLSLTAIKKIRSLGLKVLLSLEDKREREIFEDDCIILQEPIRDIFSLIKFALFCVSSGDSVAREACLLGTPTIYTGRREMRVNTDLIDLGCLFKEDTEEAILNRIGQLASRREKDNIGSAVKVKIERDWEDVTQMIIRHVKDFDRSRS